MDVTGTSPLDAHHAGLDRSFRRYAFERLRHGAPVAVADMVGGSPTGPERARQTLETLVARGMAQVSGDRLIAIDGLSVVSTRHRMRLAGKAVFTWCAADSVGIPAALEEDAEIETTCPHCSKEIRIWVRAGQPHAHADVVLWLPTCGCSNVAQEFCPDVNFFCAVDHLASWRAARDSGDGDILSVQQVAELGRGWWDFLGPRAGGTPTR